MSFTFKGLVKKGTVINCNVDRLLLSKSHPGLLALAVYAANHLYFTFEGQTTCINSYLNFVFKCIEAIKYV